MKPVKRNGKRLLALTLALLLCAALLPTAALAETYSGTTVRLEKTEGTVTVKNAAGEVKSLSGRPRLSGGWTVKTEAASYAWLSFDADSGNTLSVKLDANTLVEVRKNGGKNEVLLKNNGRLIAGSEKPLSGGQTLSVGNSSGVCGVRGSLLLVTDDQFMFLFGHGVASARGGAGQQTQLAAGQGVAYGAGGSMRRFEVQTAQISGFAQVELAGNPALTQQMYEQTAGRLDLRELTVEQAMQQQKIDEALAALLRSGLVTGSGSAEEGNNAEENGKRVDPAWGEKGLVNRSTTVSFDANGGTGYMASVTVTGALQVPACEFTRDGYTFTGWKDDYGMDHPVGSNIQGGDSGTYGEQLTLYAQWQANNPGGWNVLPYVPDPVPVPAKYAVTISDIVHGAVTASVGGAAATQAAAGETVTLTVTPDDGYEIASVSYLAEGASSATELTASGGVYSFAMPDKAVTVSAAFTPILYRIDIDLNEETSYCTITGVIGAEFRDNAYYASKDTKVTLTYTTTEGAYYYGLYAYSGTSTDKAVLSPAARSVTSEANQEEISVSYYMLAKDVTVSETTLTQIMVEVDTENDSPIANVVCTNALPVEGNFYLAAGGETINLLVTPKNGIVIRYACSDDPESAREVGNSFIVDPEYDTIIVSRDDD